MGEYFINRRCCLHKFEYIKQTLFLCKKYRHKIRLFTLNTPLNVDNIYIGLILVNKIMIQVLYKLLFLLYFEDYMGCWHETGIVTRV